MREQAEVKALLGDGCFLRRSRTPDTLWVSDAPLRFVAEKLSAAGSALCQAGFTVLPYPAGLWGIDLGPLRWLLRLSAWETTPAVLFSATEQDITLYALAGLLRAHPAPPESQPLWPIRLLIQAEQDEAGFRLACERLIKQAAESLRLHEALPSAAAGLIYRHLQAAGEG